MLKLQNQYINHFCVINLLRLFRPAYSISVWVIHFLRFAWPVIFQHIFDSIWALQFQLRRLAMKYGPVLSGQKMLAAPYYNIKQKNLVRIKTKTDIKEWVQFWNIPGFIWLARLTECARIERDSEVRWGCSGWPCGSLNLVIHHIIVWQILFCC